MKISTSLAFATRRSFLILTGNVIAIFAVITSASAQSGQVYSWNQTATGTGYSWSDYNNWNNIPAINNGPYDPTNGTAGDTVDLTGNLVVGGETVTQDAGGTTVLGTLNIGATNANAAFTLAFTTGGTLTFDNSGAGAVINEISTADGDTINTPIIMADSNATAALTINTLSAHSFTINGAITSTATSGQNLVFNSSATAGTTNINGGIANGGNLSLTSTGAGSFSIATGNVTNAGNVTLSANSTGSITISSTLDNAGTITNQGTGSGGTTISGSFVPTGGTSSVTSLTQNSLTSSLSLTNASNGTWTGNTAVQEGALYIGASGATGAAGTTITLGSATGIAGGFASVLSSNSSTINSNISIPTNAVGTLSIGGTTSGGNSGAGSPTYAGGIALNNNTLYVNDNQTAPASNQYSGSTVTLSGAVTGTGASVLNIGQQPASNPDATGTVILSGVNTGYAGTTNFLAGSLKVGTSSALGTGTLVIGGGLYGTYGNVYTPTTPVLDATVGSLTLTAAETWNTDFTFAGSNSLNLGTGAISLGTQATDANRMVIVNANTLTVGGVISSPGTTKGLTKAGGGTLVLNGVNTYTGSTIVNGGFLSFGVGATASTTANSIVINNGGNLNVSGAFTTAAGAAGVLASGLISSTSTGDLALTANDANNINFTGYNSLMLGASTSSTYTGTITPGSTGYHLGGGGATLTLSNANAVTGSGTNLTVGATSVVGAPVGALASSTLGTSSGTVKFTNANNGLTGTTTVNAGTLDLSATSASVVASLGGSAITVNNGSTLAIDWASQTLATAQNVTRAASVTLDGGTLTDTGTAGAATTDTITGALTLNSGANSITVTPGAKSGELTASSLVLGSHSFASVTGTNLGVAVPGTANDGNIIFATAPTGYFVGNTSQTTGNAPAGALNTAIIPNLIDGSSFVTYDTTTGLRPLASAEYSTSIASGDNVDLTTATAGSLGTVSANTSINSLILGAAGTLTITDGDALTDSSGALLFNASATIAPSTSSGALDFGSNTGYIDTLGNTGTISAAITGSNGVVKTGSGTLALNGSSNFSGGLYILNGTVTSTSATGATPFGSGNIYLGDTGGSNSTTLTFPTGPSGNLTVANNFVIQGGNTGVATISGPINGYVNGNARGVTLTGSVTLGSANAAGVVVGHNLTLNTGNSDYVTNVSMDFTGAFLDPAGLTGPGGLLTIIANSTNGSSPSIEFGNASSNYSGGTLFAVTSTAENNPNVSFNSMTTGTPFGTGTVTINTLRVNDSVATTVPGANAQVWNGDWSVTNGSTLNWNLTGTIDLGSIASGTTRTITTGGGILSIAGAIQNGSNGITNSLTKAGSGTMILNGQSIYTGPTYVTGGTLTAGTTSVANVSGAFGDNSDVTVSSGAVLSLVNGSANNSNQIGALAGAGSVTLGTATLSVGGSNNGGNFSGVISGAGGTLTKIGTGTQTLSGANTYTGGTNINKGVLNVGSVQGTTSGPLGGGTGSLPTGLISFGGGTLQYSSVNHTDYSSKFSTAASQAYSVDTNGQNVTFASALVSAGGSLSKVGGGGALTLTNANTYSGGTTVSAGTLYGDGGVYNATASSTTSAFGTGAVTVNSTAAVGGNGVYAPGAGINGIALNGTNISSGVATLISGGVQPAIGGATTQVVGGAAGSAISPALSSSVGGLVLDNRTAQGVILNAATLGASSPNANLTFYLGAGTVGADLTSAANLGMITTTDSTIGQTKFNFANPNIDSTYISVLGNTPNELAFASGDTITAIDLTNDNLQLSLNTPYLLIQAGNNADYSGITTSGGSTGGVANNGYVTDLSLTIGANTAATEYYASQLYLFNGNLEIVPEPGTWALMLGGLAFLVFVQRRRFAKRQ